MVEGTGTTVAPEKKQEGDQPKASTRTEDPSVRLSNEGNTQARPETPRNGNGSTENVLPQVTVGDGQTDTPQPPQTQPRQLNDETIKKYAEELHGAVNRDGMLWGKNPDKERIFQLLNSLGEADRKALEDAYVNASKNKDHRSLRDELRERLDGDDWRKAEARLNTKDGRTNDAGNLMVALSAINDNRGDAERRVLETFATLNSDQRKLLNEDFQKHYGIPIDQALKDFGVSDKTMKALSFINKPIEQRTAEDIKDFARFAVQEKNLDYLAVALRGDTPAAQEARKQLQGDEQFRKQLVDAFKPDGSFLSKVWNTAVDVALGPVDDLIRALSPKEENLQLLTALDYLNEGRPSLATIALNNTGGLFGWFDNKENVTLAVDNATDLERRNFRMGQDLAASGRAPANDQEKSALEYYNKINKAFEDAGDDRETAQWKAKLLYGKDSVQANIAGSDNANGKFSALENMTEAQWKALKDGGPQARQDFEKFLGTFVNENERTRMMQILDGKLGKETFAQAQTVRRTLTEVIEQNKGSVFLGMGTSYDGKNIANAIANMSPQEAENYKNDATFRAEMDKFVKDNLGNSEKRYAEQLLRQVAESGKPPEIGPVEKVMQNAMNGVEPKTAITDIETLLQSDPELRRRLSGDINTMSPADKALRQAIDQTMTKAIFESPAYQAMAMSGAHDGGYSSVNTFGDMQKQVYSQLWERGSVPVTVKADLNLKNDKFYEQAGSLPQAEREALLRNPNINAEEKKLIEAVAAQGGKMNLEDRMRAFVLGNGSSADDFKSALRQLSADQKQELKEQYAAKYGKPLEDDFLDKVDKKDQQLFKNLLTPGELDGRQDYYDNLEQWLKSRSGGGLAPDATGLTVERAMTDQAALHQWFNHQFEKMPPDVQEAANAYFRDALEQHKQSKAKMAEIMATVAITAAALAATPFTGGASLALVASVAFVAGGVAKVAIHRAVEGGDYDWSKALGNFVGGGAEGALNMLGGKIVEGMFKGFNVAGNALAVNLRTAQLSGVDDAVVGRAFTKLIAEGGKNVSDDALTRFATTVKPGASAAEIESIKRVAQQSIAQNYDAILNRATRVALGGVDNTVIGAGAAEAQLVINAAIDGRALTADEMLKIALIGAATGAVVGTAIRGGMEGHSIYVQAKRTPQGDVLLPSGPGERPIKLKDADGNVREVTAETTVKPGEVIVDGPAANPRVLNEILEGPRTIAVDGKGYKRYNLTGADGNPLPISESRITLGRAADADISVPGNSDISRFHAQIEFTPDGPRLKDMNSLNGTYVNGQQVPREGIMLKPGDKIQLAKGGPEFTFGEQYSPGAYRQHALEFNGQNLPIDKAKVVLGRGTDADIKFAGDNVSRNHAELEFTADGPMLRDKGSTNGTYVNGERITGDVKLKPGDRIRIGDNEFVFRDNKFVQGDVNAPRQVLEYQRGQNNVVAKPEAVAQSNQYKDGWQVDGRIEDGFQMLSGNQRINADGTWHDPYRPATVVDRTQDAVLNETIREAQQRFKRLAEEVQNATSPAAREAAEKKLATELAIYSKDKLHPAGWSENQVDAAYYAFRAQNGNKQILLGDYINQAARGQGAGVCQHQALLFKVLADEFGLDASLVAGMSARRPPGGFPPGTQPNHAWNEVTINGERYVFDPRQEEYAKLYNEVPYHTPGRDFTSPRPPEVKAEDVQVRRGDMVRHDDANWKVEGFNGQTGDIILSHPAQKPITQAEFAQANPGRELAIGGRYKVMRSDGSIQDGWRYEGVNADGTLRFYKEDGIKLEMKRTDLAKENPNLVKGHDGDILMAPNDAQKVLDNPQSSTAEFLDAAETGMLSDGAIDPAQVTAKLKERLVNDPELLKGDNAARALALLDFVEDAAVKQSLVEDMIRRMPTESMGKQEVLTPLMSHYYVSDSASKIAMRNALGERLSTALDTAGIDDFSNFARITNALELRATPGLSNKFLESMRRISLDQNRLSFEQISALQAFQRQVGSTESANFLGLYERAVAAYERGGGAWWNKDTRGWRISEPMHTPLSDEQLDKLWTVLEAQAKYTNNPVPPAQWDAWLSEFGMKRVKNGEYHLHWIHNGERVKYADGTLGGHPEWHGSNRNGLLPVYAKNMFDGLISLGVLGRLP
jgi:pSer/pThr/pTyr-binding forkhead associated (FHA) protein